MLGPRGAQPSVSIGRSVSFWLNDQQRNAIETEYNARVYQAFLSYEIGKLTEKKSTESVCAVSSRVGRNPTSSLQ